VHRSLSPDRVHGVPRRHPRADAHHRTAPLVGDPQPGRAGRPRGSVGTACWPGVPGGRGSRLPAVDGSRRNGDATL